MSNLEFLESVYLDAAQGIKSEWLDNADTNWYDYVMALNSSQRFAYLIVVMHNQVFNGGLDQYFVNGYGQFAKETISALKEVGAQKKALILEQAFKLVNDEDLSAVEFRKRLLNNEIKYLFEEDSLSESLNALDMDYYNSEDEDVQQLLTQYLVIH